MRFKQTPGALSDGRPLRIRSCGLVAGPAVLSFFLLSLLSFQTLSAPAISPALIEQAKKMSPAQREALARQYGIPLGGVAASGDALVEEQVPREALQRPRGSAPAAAVRHRRICIETSWLPLIERVGTMSDPNSCSSNRARAHRRQPWEALAPLIDRTYPDR